MGKKQHKRFKLRNELAANLGRKKTGQLRISDFFGNEQQNLEPKITKIITTTGKISGFQANNQKRIE